MESVTEVALKRIKLILTKMILSIWQKSATRTNFLVGLVVAGAIDLKCREFQLGSMRLLMILLLNQKYLLVASEYNTCISHDRFK